jgi:hypothetical protein
VAADLEEALALLRAISSDLDAMKSPTNEPGEADWFGYFEFWEMSDSFDTCIVQWPNLAVTQQKIAEFLEKHSNASHPTETKAEG